MKFSHFVSGTAIGIIPKIVVVVLVSQGIILGLSGEMMSLLFGLLAAFAILLYWAARRRLGSHSSE